MKIKTISYQAVKNLGNYSSERLEMFAEVDEGEDPDTAAAQLRWRVNSILEKHYNFGTAKLDDSIPEDF